MAHDPVAIRYAKAFFDTVKAHDQVKETQQQLHRLGELLDQPGELRQLLAHPGISTEEKVMVLQRTLKPEWSERVGDFVQLVVSRGRADLLPEMVEAFSEAVDTDQGRIRAVVRSAHPLPETLLTRLRKQLEVMEAKTVEITTEIHTELLGGLQVQLGYRVIDHSVQRQLADLRQQLKAIRVH